MKRISLSDEYLSAFTLQMSLLLHAGINVADGLHLLAEDEKNKSIKELLLELADDVDDGKQLSEAMENSGCFPSYMVNMTYTGEMTGRGEESFKAMAEHYESQRQLNDRIRRAVTYPLVLLVLMLLIIGILLVKVLPIFNTVYQQLGGQLTGMAAGLLGVGEGLKNSLPVLGVILAIVLLAVIIIGCVKSVRYKVERGYRKHFGGKGILKKVGMARFASALSMGMMSGLPMEEALEMAMNFNEEADATKARYEQCLSKLKDGEPIAGALRDTEIFAPMYCRMLALGVRSGAGDSIMEEISKRLEEDAVNAIDDRVSRIEPTIVIVTSIIVGIILLAVMLPLMNIMSTIA
ncbi:MAG: type II secretion system F family protein [Lachnospiraceae bacterium]|nr:type II secretion system F family protein [Lachnospiraceae bacterium]